MSLFIVFGSVLCLLHAPHTLFKHPYIFVFPLLSFFNSTIIIFFLKKRKQKYFKIIKNYKKIIEKSKKMKNVLFHFIVSVRSPAPCDTHFQKTKNSFFSLLVSI